jgi:Tol biopolymer transport system component
VRRRWLAFDSNRERENRDLYMMRGDGSERTRLTQGPGEEREPSFSPDGTRLAYVSEHEGVALIYVYDFRSGELRQISRSPARIGRADEFANGPAWFPDGTRLAFHRGGELLVVDADGDRVERTLAAGEDYVDGYRNAAVTPDGREVVCDRWHEIVAVDVQTGARRQIIPRRAVTIEAPSLSPDGSQFAYSVVCIENFLQITLAPTSGERQKSCKTPLISLSGGSRATNAAWGPGDYIAYESDPDEGDVASSITLVKLGEAPCVFDRGGAHEANPAWAPVDFALPTGFSPF